MFFLMRERKIAYLGHLYRRVIFLFGVNNKNALNLRDSGVLINDIIINYIPTYIKKKSEMKVVPLF
jgi:hypothetical protein